jgi:hypothetical protein
MFYRLFRAPWLPGIGVNWQLSSSPNNANPQNYQYIALPFDGLLLDFVVLIAVLLLVDWMLKMLRRYS